MTTTRRSLMGMALALALAAGAGMTVAGAGAAERFLDALDDVPLMPGLAEVTEQSVAFESATGRIVDVAAVARTSGRLTPEAVRRFYDETLPELGWTARGTGRFARAGEVLTVLAGSESGRVVVRFSLRPE